MLNAFQQGQQAFEARRTQDINNTRGENREKGINALASEFGDQALAPNEFTAIKNSARADKKFIATEEQRGLNNARTSRLDEISEEERTKRNMISGLGQIVGGIKAGIKGGSPIDEVITRFGPVLKNAFGVSEEELLALPQSIQENPGLLDDIEGALRQQTDKTRKAIGTPITIRMPNGTLETRQRYNDGTFDVLGGVDQAAINQTSRADSTADNAVTNRRKTIPELEEELRRARARGKSLGKAEGEVAAQDLPLSKTAVAAVKAKIKSAADTTDRALNALTSVRDKIGFANTGFIGGVTKFIPGTPGFKLVEELLPVVSQEFVTNLQNMRDLSKTGGAVGNVSNAEGDKLQGINASLNIGVGKEQLLEQITIMEDAIKTSRDNMKAAFEADEQARLNQTTSQKKRLVFNPATGRLE